MPGDESDGPRPYEASQVDALELERLLGEAVQNLGMARKVILEEPTPASWIALTGVSSRYVDACELKARHAAESETEGTANHVLGVRNTQFDVRHPNLLTVLDSHIWLRWHGFRDVKAQIAAVTRCTVDQLCTEFDDKVIEKKYRDERLIGYQTALAPQIVAACIKDEVYAENEIIVRAGLTKRKYERLRNLGVPLPNIYKPAK